MNFTNLPTAYFPDIEYFFLLKNHEQVNIDANDLFEKQSFRNRTSLLTANGLQDLSVPLNRAWKKSLYTHTVQISYSEDWIKNHIRAIESAYRRSPYYEYYFDSIQAILEKKHDRLIDLNLELIEYLASKIGLTCELKHNENLSPENLNEINTQQYRKQQFQVYPYLQTFSDRFGFQNNLSILDLLFNEGPNSICILEESAYRDK